MILIIIFLGMILLGVVFSKLGENNYSTFGENNYSTFGENNYSTFGDCLVIFGGLSTMLGSAALIVSIIVIIVSHATAPKIIQENKLNYEGLCKRAAIITSEYEDVSKSDVIADITAWNIEVYKTKYWTDNPWTNWYNPEIIADNLDYILLE